MRTNKFGPIYGKSSTGKIKVWEAEVILENDQAKLITTSGYDDGKKTSSTRLVKGKNIGRSNETTPYNQAIFEAVSKMNKKKDEGYVENKNDLEKQSLLLPMLAHSYTKRSHNIVWPAYVQPKLNGVRCICRITNKGIEYISRKGKKYTNLGHLNESVKALLKETKVPLDGEIFHPEWSFQEIIRALKKYREGITEQLQYWIYDIVDTEEDFIGRFNNLERAFITLSGASCVSNPKYDKLVVVKTMMVQNEVHFKVIHKEHTKSAFEGTIIRNLKGKYVLKNRSKDLQKYKDFQDSEYEIIGGSEATGNDSGTVIFTCQTTEGKTFSVRPMGSREQRREWLRDIKSFVGKKLTVRYQELSEEGTPIFPVGITVRDYED